MLVATRHADCKRVKANHSKHTCMSTPRVKSLITWLPASNGQEKKTPNPTPIGMPPISTLSLQPPGPTRLRLEMPRQLVPRNLYALSGELLCGILCFTGGVLICSWGVGDKAAAGGKTDAAWCWPDGNRGVAA